MNSGIERAFSEAGGPAALAKKLKRSRQSANQWRKLGHAPADLCPAIEQLTGVRCEDLSPDTKWVRVKDKAWPNGGRPLIDTTQLAQAA